MCSRQDNLQQHYRIHLSPGSRRSFGRSSTRRRVRAAMPPPSASSTSSDLEYKSDAYPKSESPLPEHLVLGSPPPLGPATFYHDQASPVSDTSPPLSAATAHSATYGSMPNMAFAVEQHSPSGRDSASPEPPFASANLLSDHQGGSLESQYMSVAATYRQPYPSEQAHTPTYGYDASSSSTYGQAYTQHTPPTEYQTPQVVSGLSASSTSLHQIHTRQPTPLSSRHSIPHISHPFPQTHQQQPYTASSHSGASTMNPLSPASSHHSLTASHTSGPSMPAFPSTLYGDSYTPQPFLEDATSSSASNGYLFHAPHVVSSNVYTLSSSIPLSADSTISRLPSPPPVLARIHPAHGDTMASIHARRASMLMLERHYSAPSIMTHQQEQYAAEASQAYAYERLSYGFMQGYEVKQGMDGYGRQEVYGG